MLNIEKEFFAPTYHFFDNNEYFGTLKASFFFAKARFIAQTGNYEFIHEKNEGGKFFCRLNRNVEATAQKSSANKYSYNIKFKEFDYVLVAGEFFQKRFEFHFELFKNGVHIGSIKEKNNERNLTVDFGNEIPSIIQCYIFWLGYRSWNNNPRSTFLKNPITRSGF